MHLEQTKKNLNDYKFPKVNVLKIKENRSHTFFFFLKEGEI